MAAKVLYLVFIFGFTLFLTACAGGLLSSPIAFDSTFFELVPTNPVVQVGQQVHFQVNKVDTDGAHAQDPKHFGWTTSEPVVATIDAKGVATTLRVGTVTITAFDATDPKRQLITTLTVVSANGMVHLAANPQTIVFALPSTGLDVGYFIDRKSVVSFYDLSGDEPKLNDRVTLRKAKGASWMAVAPTGQFLYVLNRETENVSVLAIATSGNLQEVAGSPFPVQKDAGSIAVTPDGKTLLVHSFEAKNSREFAILPAGDLTSVVGVKGLL